MIVYEVNLYVRAAIAAEYRAWLDLHVQEIVAMPGFLGAEVYVRLEPAPAEGELVLCTQYRLRDAASLADYLREHAPRLRADGLARFGDAFRAERRVLELAARY